jgi:predicted MFS family arabinose efflux permease
MLGAATSLGSILGALYAGSRTEGANPFRTYLFAGLIAALSLAVFALTPFSLFTPLPLAVIGFLLFAQAVWNTARVRLQAAAAFQARLQSITTMAFVTGGALGQLWGGIVVDRFGVHALLWGSAALIGIILWVGVWNRRALWVSRT